jgi:hypothetical protein
MIMSIKETVKRIFLLLLITKNCFAIFVIMKIHWIFSNFKGGKRDVTVADRRTKDRRTKKDFAEYIKYLVDEVFTDSIKIKFVLDIIQISDLDGKQNL